MKTQIELIRELAKIRIAKSKVINDKLYEKAANLRAKEKEVYNDLNKIDANIRQQNFIRNTIQDTVERLGKDLAS